MVFYKETYVQFAQEEKEEKREMARGRVDHIKGRYRNLRVRRTRLRMKYVALLEA